VQEIRQPKKQVKAGKHKYKTSESSSSFGKARRKYKDHSGEKKNQISGRFCKIKINFPVFCLKTEPRRLFYTITHPK
jgi:hypothetical protein